MFSSATSSLSASTFFTIASLVLSAAMGPEMYYRTATLDRTAHCDCAERGFVCRRNVDRPLTPRPPVLVDDLLATTPTMIWKYGMGGVFATRKGDIVSP